MNSNITWVNAGAKLRVFNKEKFGPQIPRITIFDSEIARLTIGEPEIPKDENYLTLWTESKSFALILKQQFNNMWKNSEPIENYLKKTTKKPKTRKRTFINIKKINKTK